MYTNENNLIKDTILIWLITATDINHKGIYFIVKNLLSVNSQTGHFSSCNHISSPLSITTRISHKCVTRFAKSGLIMNASNVVTLMIDL